MRPEWTQPLCERGLGASKAGAKSKATEALHLLVEAEGPAAAEAIIADLTALVSGGKQAKLASAAVSCMRELLGAFGAPQVLPVKAVGKSFSTIFAHQDKTVKAEGLQLVKQLHKCIGQAAVTVFLGDLKPIQLKEVQQEVFAKTPGASHTPTRFLRTASKHSRTENNANIVMKEEHAESFQPSAATELDAYDLAEPQPILERLPAQFYESVESGVWKERKEALEALLPIVRVPRIQENAKYGELVDALLKRISSDANILVVIAGVQVVEGLARGLRAAFNPFRSNALSALLERSKEKKTSVLEAIRAALSAIHLPQAGFPDLLDTDLKPFLAHKNPQVRSETLGFITRSCMPKSNNQLNNSKKSIKTLVDAVIPCMDDGSEEVREAAAACLARLVGFAGEKVVMPLMEGSLDKLKLAKIAQAQAKKDDTKPPSNTTETNKQQPPVVMPCLAVDEKSIPVKPIVLGSNAPAINPLHASKQHATDFLNDYGVQWKWTQGEAMAFFANQTGLDLANGLSDAQWKTRLSTVESLHAACVIPSLLKHPEYSSEALVRMFEAVWLKESNLQVPNNRQFDPFALILCACRLWERSCPCGRKLLALCLSLGKPVLLVPLGWQKG